MPTSPRWARALASALALGLLGCAEREPATRAGAANAEGPPVSGGTAVIAELSDLQRPMPITWDGGLDSDLVDIMYMGLTRMVWRDGRPAYLLSDESPMALAYRWQFANDDSTAIRYFMRSDLKWSDGHPITSADVVWTFRTMMDPVAASPRAQDVNMVQSVTAENDSVVIVTFKQRSPSMLFQAGLPIAPKHAFDDVPPSRLMTHPVFANPTRLVVSGPFRIGNWRANERFTLVHNPSFRVRPRLNAIVVRIIPDPTTRLTELETGRVDFVRPVSIDHIRGLLERMPSAQVHREEKRFWEFIGYNPTRVEAFRDAEVRRALGMAIDVPGIIRDLGLGDYVEQAFGPYPPIFADLYDPQRDRPLQHDPAGARRILEARGWRDADGDRILEKDGKPFSFTLLTNSGNQRRQDVTQMIQSQWRAIGVDVRLQQLDQASVVERETKKDYEAVLNGWGVGLDADLSAFFAPGAHYNVVSYENQEVAGLIERAKAQATLESAAPFWRAAATRIVQDQPYTWLYYYDQVSAANPRLRGMKVDTFGAFQNVWEWWIPADQQRRAGAGAPPAEES